MAQPATPQTTTGALASTPKCPPNTSPLDPVQICNPTAACLIVNNYATEDVVMVGGADPTNNNRPWCLYIRKGAQGLRFTVERYDTYSITGATSGVVYNAGYTIETTGQTTLDVTSVPVQFPSYRPKDSSWWLIAATLVSTAGAGLEYLRRQHNKIVVQASCLEQYGPDLCGSQITASDLAGPRVSGYIGVWPMVVVGALVVLLVLGYIVAEGYIGPYGVSPGDCAARSNDWASTPWAYGTYSPGSTTSSADFLCSHLGLCYCRSALQEQGCAIAAARSNAGPDAANGYSYSASVAKQKTGYNCACTKSGAGYDCVYAQGVCAACKNPDSG